MGKASTAQDVITFWFEQHSAEHWFGASETFDNEVRETLTDVYERASRGELWAWRTTPKGRLAEIILLDQISRQLNRGSAKAFANDGAALALAQEAVAQGADVGMTNDELLFLYLPYEHSESALIQEQSIALFQKLSDTPYLDYAIAHQDTVKQFGRFPMRNAALGRENTPQEIAYMKEREGKIF